MELLIQYKYLAFFLGMIFGGDIVLITGIYLATRNHFDIRALVILAYVATMLSDLVWYYIGVHLTKRRLSTFPLLEKKRDLVDHVSRFMDKHGFKAVFYSKFIYGTRTVTQVLAGVRHLNPMKFILANTAGTFAYMAILLFLGYVLHLSTGSIQYLVKNGAVVLAVFVFVMMAINIWINKNIKKHLYQ